MHISGILAAMQKLSYDFVVHITADHQPSVSLHVVLVVSFRGQIIFTLGHTVVSVVKMTEASSSSTDMLSDYFETLPDNCRQRKVKRIGKINGLEFSTLNVSIGDQS